MADSEELKMSEDEIYEFIKQYPDITQETIRFTTSMNYNKEQAIAREFEPFIKEMQKVMSDLINDKDSCVTNAVQFAYSSYNPILEWRRQAQSEEG